MFFEERLIFFPSRYPEGDWNPRGLTVEDAEFTADDGVRLHGWFCPVENPRAVVLISHGNAGNITHRYEEIKLWQRHLGVSIFIYDYRGFGRSSAGLPSEAMAAEDAQAAWDWLAQQYPDQRRFIFGHSLGGAIAVNLASEVRDEAGVIVEGSFTSIPDVVSTFRWGWLPVAPLITQRFDAASRIAQVGSPLLVVHGSQDSLIPYRLGQDLYERARAPKRFVLVEGGSHHNTNAVGQAQYRAALADLFGLGSAGL